MTFNRQIFRNEDGTMPIDGVSLTAGVVLVAIVVAYVIYAAGFSGAPNEPSTTFLGSAQASKAGAFDANPSTRTGIVATAEQSGQETKPDSEPAGAAPAAVQRP